MSNLKRAKISIRGTRALLFHRFQVDFMEKTSRKEKSGSAGNDFDEWRKTFFSTGDNQLYLPGYYFFSNLKEGAKYVKEGKGSISKKVAATLQIVDDIVLLNRYMPEGWESIETKDMTQNPSDSVYLHICGVVNPSTKGRNVRYRIACSPGWECEFTIMWDASLVSVPNIQRVVEDAGILLGVGDGRSTGNGRYEVVSFELDKS
jgi:hypothetical protein